MLRKTGFTRFFGGKSSIKTRKSGFTRFFGGKRGNRNRKSGFSGSSKTRIPPLVPKHQHNRIFPLQYQMTKWMDLSATAKSRKISPSERSEKGGLALPARPWQSVKLADNNIQQMNIQIVNDLINVGCCCLLS